MRVSDNEAGLLDAYGEVTEQIKLLEKKKAELKKALGTTFEQLQGDGTLVGKDYAIKYKLSPGRKTIDKEALSAAGIDVTEYEKVGKPFLTLSASRLG